jgi:hypothetical protein
MTTPSEASVVGNSTICAGASAQLNVSGDLLNVSWTPTASLSNPLVANPTATPATTTTYTVTGTQRGNNLIDNGDFSLGNTGFTSDYTNSLVVPLDAARYRITSNPQIAHAGFVACGDHTTGTGNMMVVNAANVVGQNVWCQTVNVAPNTNYAFSAWLASVFSVAPAQMRFKINGNYIGQTLQATATDCDWQEFYSIWNSGANTTAQICMTNINTQYYGNDFAVDDISFTPLCPVSSTVTLTVAPNPVPVATSNGPVCSGENIELSATNGDTYAWSGPNGFTGTGSPTINGVTTAADGPYTVTATTAAGCTGTATVNVMVGTVPTPSVDADTTLCEGASLTLTAGGGSAYAWSNGATTAVITVTPNTTTTYVVTISDPSGCSITDTVVVTVIPAGTISVSTIPVAETCNAAADGAINLTTNAVSFIWNTGATTQNLANLGPGYYYVTATDALGCTATASGRVTGELEPPVIVGCPNDTTVVAATGNCQAVVTFSAGVTDNCPNPTLSFSPASGSTFNLGSTVVTVTATDAAFNTSTCSFTVTVTSDATATISGQDTICSGSSTTLTASGGGVYAWNTGATTAAITVSPTATTDYSVTVTMPSGCTASATELVVVNNPPAALVVTNVHCGSSNNGAVFLETNGAIYAWSNGATTQNLTGVPSGTYSVTVTSAVGGCTTSASTVVNNESPATASVIGADTICSDASTQLNVTGTLLDIQWSPAGSLSNANIANPTASPDTTTTYVVTAYQESGNLIANGDFSQGDMGFSSDYTNSYVVPLDAAKYQITNNPQIPHPGFTACGDHTTGTGNMMVVNGANVVGQNVWCQTVSVVPNTDYAFSAWVASVYSVAPALMRFNINGSVLGQTLQATATDCDWKQFYATWNSGANTSAQICMTNINTQYNGNDFAIDDISFSAICPVTDTVVVTVLPTPQTAALNTGPVCAGSSVNLDATNGASYAWSGPNGFTSNDGFAQLNNVTNAEAGVYTVTTTGFNGCTATASTTLVVNSINLVLNASDTICAGNAAYLIVSGGVSYLWDNGSTEDQMTASPTTATTYSVTGTDANGCTGSASATVEVVTPAASIAGAGTIQPAGSATLTATGGTGFAWSNGATTSSITVSPAVTTIYSVTVTTATGCTATADATVTMAVTASISGDTVICAGGSAALAASGGTDYAWSNGATDASINVSPASTTTYTVTVTNQGSTATASHTVAVNALPIAAITGDNLSCFNVNVGLVASGGTQYLWSTGETDANILVNLIATDTFTVTVSVAGGCSSTATHILVIDTAATATVTATDVTCSGSNDGTITMTTNATGILWSNGATTANLTGLAAGTYTATLTNAAGCTSNAIATVNPAVFPVPSISGGTLVCAGSPTTLTASGGDSYAWSNGGTDAAITVSPNTATTYTVTVTSSTGCTASADATVNMLQLGAPTVIVEPTFCNVNNGSITLVTSANTFAWSNGETTQNLTGLGAGTYTVTLSDANGCSTTASYVVSPSSTVTAAATGNNVVCSGNQTTLTASGGTSFAWSNGATTAAIDVSPLTTTTYTVTVSNVDGCSATADLTVTANALPNAAISGTTLICAGGNTTLTASGGSSYLWNDGATTAAITVSPVSETTFTVTVTNANGCTATADATVTIGSQLSVSVSGSTSICDGGSATLTATGGGSYAWDNGSTTASITVSPSSTTTYVVTITGNGCVATASGTVTVNPIPNAAIGGNTSYCSGGSTVLTASGGDSYVWSNAGTTASIQVNPITNTTYTVTVSTAAGCTATADITVTPHTTPTPGLSGTSSICLGQSTTLTATGGDAYAWSNAETTAAITVAPTTNTTYSVTVSSAAGCTASAAQTVTVNSTPTASATSINSSCNTADGSVTLTTDATSFVWSNGATTQNLANVASGTYTVTVSNAGGCTATTSIQVSDLDNQAPTVTCPSNITVSNDAGVCGAVVTFAATANDNCSASINYSHASGSTFAIGTTTVTVTVYDGAGNTATCSFSVTVNDVEAPVLSCPAQVYGVRSPGETYGVATFLSTVTDNCSATLTYSRASGSIFQAGTTPVIVTATDPSGNISRCTIQVVMARYLYVDQTATAGANNGSDWSNAYLSLSNAIAQSQSNLDTILVAAGAYSPGGLATSTFTIMPRVPMYGGFPNGLHPSLWTWSQRNVAANPTILDGNNVNRRVVIANNSGSDPVMSVFDGFTIRNANGTLTGGGMLINANGANQTAGLNVRNCTFVNNLAPNGGAVGVVSSAGATASPIFTNCTFTNNTASGAGGGMYLVADKAGIVTATISNSTFTGNTAFSASTPVARAGAIGTMTLGVGSTVTLTVNNSTFSNNTAQQQGGAVLNFSRTGGVSNTTINGSTFANNTASGGGAAANQGQGGTANLTFNGSTFNANVGSNSGGAVFQYVENAGCTGNVTIDQCMFTGNTSTVAGGAVSNVSFKGAVGNLNVTRSRFAGNTSGQRGAAIVATSSTRNATSPATASNTTVQNSVFYGNTSNGRAAVFYNEGTNGAPSTLVVRNSTVANNTASVGTGLFNMATLPATATTTLVNTIFWNNTIQQASDALVHNLGSGASVGVENSLLQQATFAANETGTGTFTDLGGNIASDPLFVDLAAGDLRLQNGSPAIDAGTTVALSVDFDGNTRSQGNGVDMGAYETTAQGGARLAQTTEPLAPISATVFPNPTSGTFTVALDREVNGYAQVFDLQGRLVVSESLNGANQVQFDLGAADNGIYLLRIVSGSEVTTKQVVISKP